MRLSLVVLTMEPTLWKYHSTMLKIDHAENSRCHKGLHSGEAKPVSFYTHPLNPCR